MKVMKHGNRVLSNGKKRLKKTVEIKKYENFLFFKSL